MTKKLVDVIMMLIGIIFMTVLGTVMIGNGSYESAQTCLNLLDPFVRLLLIVGVAYGFKAAVLDEITAEKNRRKAIRDKKRAEFHRAMEEARNM